MKQYKYKLTDRDYFFSKFQDYLKDNKQQLNEKIEIYPGRFIPELQKFLNKQIKKGSIKGLTEDDTENIASVLSNKLREL